MHEHSHECTHAHMQAHMCYKVADYSEQLHTRLLQGKPLIDNNQY